MYLGLSIVFFIFMLVLSDLYAISNIYFLILFLNFWFWLCCKEYGCPYFPNQGLKLNPCIGSMKS